MRLWPRHWQADVWVCSIKDHVIPARFARELGPEDAYLGMRTDDGRRFARCLRCDAWIVHGDPAASDVRYERLPSIESLARPRRDRILSDAIVMRFIALNKALHAVGFSILALLLFLVRTNLVGLKSFADRVLPVIRGPMGDTGAESSRPFLARQLERVLELKGSELGLLLLLALLYATVEWAEAIGLWLERVWAEYLTVLATAGFLPLEIHELTKRVTALRVGALVVNVALIVWLVWNKRLFGVRGGHHALHQEIDWPRVLATMPEHGAVYPPRSRLSRLL